MSNILYFNLKLKFLLYKKAIDFISIKKQNFTKKQITFMNK